MLRKVLVEAFSWWHFFCFAAPGSIGVRLRAHFIKRNCQTSNHVYTGQGLWINGAKNIVFGSRILVGRKVSFESSAGSIKIGNNVAFNEGVILGADYGSISIGDFTIIGMNSVMRAANHKYSESPQIPIQLQGHDEGNIVIGKNVWIGANVTIMPNTQIGDHCVIGAGSVVTKNIPDRSIAAGVPAKVIKEI